MFEIESGYMIKTDIPIISDNFHVFHFDEFPVLFGGTNKYGNKIIGSLAYEDVDEDAFRYFHVVVSSKQYFDFIKRKLSYKNLLYDSNNIFVLDKDINGKVLKSFHVPIEYIPRDYLPLENSYCPNVENVLGYEFSFSLKGSIADLNEAFVSQVASISRAAESVIQKAIDSLNIKGLNPELHQYAFTEGSFKINFRIKFSKQSLFHEDEPLKKYFTNFIDYSINKLSEEAEKLYQNDLVDSSFNNQIVEPLNQVYKSYHQIRTEEDLQKVIDSLLETPYKFEEICDQLGKGFAEIEVSSLGDIQGKKDESVIGFVDREFAQKIDRTTDLLTTFYGSDSDEDFENTEYLIQVYNLNTDSRKGNAHIFNYADKNKMDNPKIQIEGLEDLTGSIYTESLHLNQWIRVLAKARREKGKYKFLRILNK